MGTDEGLLQGCRRELLACCVLATWISLLALMPALTVGVILDRVVHTRATTTLVAVLATFLFFHVCEIVFTSLHDRLLLHASQVLAAQDEERFLNRLSVLPFEALESLAPGQAQDRYAALGSDVRFLIDWRIGRVSVGVGAGVTAAALLWVHPPLGAGVLLLGFGQGLLLLAGQLRLRQCAQEVQSLRGELAAWAQQAFNGLPTLRAHAAWVHWSRGWGHARRKHDEAVARHSLFVLRRTLGGLFHERATQALILGLGAWEAMEGRLSIGQLVMLNLLFRQLASHLRQFAQLVQRRVAFQASRRALHAFWRRLPQSAVHAPDADADHQPRGRAASLTVQGLGFETREGRRVLEGLDFQLPLGATLAVIGPSGAGKSTLLKLLCGLYRPSHGRALARGRPCANQSGHVYLSQKEFLFRGSIADNVLLNRPVDSQELDDLLTELGPAPVGGAGDAILRGASPAAALSGGERQRVFLARAALQGGCCLFLDEPTTALDAARAHAVAMWMHRLAGQVECLVFATHDLQLAGQADYSLWLQNGRLRAFGPSAAVLADYLSEAELGAQVTLTVA